MMNRIRRPFSSTLYRLSSTVSRKERQAALENRQLSSGKTWLYVGVGAAVFGSIGLVVHDIRNNPDGALAGIYKDSFAEKAVNYVWGHVDEIFEPQNDSLLPDWPTAPCYAGVPLGTPCPPTLIIDVEKTLIGSVHDAKYGWRHVKRPGVDKLINSLSQYYEIVLFSENDIGVAQDILQALDPEQKCHKLGMSAGEQRGNVLLKRLDIMNRDINKIILIDDSPEASQLFPRNTLLIEPFTNISDKTDMSLIQLIPLLQAMIHDGVSDFRDAIDDLGTHDAKEAATEYRKRVSDAKRLEYFRRNQGLGGLIRGNKYDNEDGEDARSSIILTPAQIVGGIDKSVLRSSEHDTAESLLGFKPVKKDEKPPSVKKAGAFATWWEDREKEKASHDKIRLEKMNELYQKRESEKHAKKLKANKVKKEGEEDEDDY